MRERCQSGLRAAREKLRRLRRARRRPALRIDHFFPGPMTMVASGVWHVDHGQRVATPFLVHAHDTPARLDSTIEQ